MMRLRFALMECMHMIGVFILGVAALASVGLAVIGLQRMVEMWTM